MRKHLLIIVIALFILFTINTGCFEKFISEKVIGKWEVTGKESIWTFDDEHSLYIESPFALYMDSFFSNPVERISEENGSKINDKMIYGFEDNYLYLFVGKYEKIQTEDETVYIPFTYIFNFTFEDDNTLFIKQIAKTVDIDGELIMAESVGTGLELILFRV